MKIAIVVFKSKTQVFKFIDQLRERGISATTAPTPSQARIGCGISAKIDARYVSLAKQIIASGEYSGFYGIYQITRVGGRTETVKIG